MDLAQAVAAGVVHGVGRSAAPLRRRARARVHEHRRSGWRHRTWQIPGGGNGGRRAHGAERGAADGPIGLARARGAVLRPAVSRGRRSTRPPCAASSRRGRATSAPRSCAAAASAAACCPLTEPRQLRAVADVPDWNMRVFECDRWRDARVSRRRRSRSRRDPADLAWQREALFDPGLRTTRSRGCRRCRRRRPPAGTAGAPCGPHRRGRRHDGRRSRRRCASRSSLVLRDSFDPSWHAEVDGVPAEIVRANGRYRAVALPPGRHVIRFSYRPRDLAAGLIISVMTAVSRCSASRGSHAARGCGVSGVHARSS